MVSTMSVTSSSPTSTMSEWAEVTKMFAGMVDIGLSLAHIYTRGDLHAYILISPSMCSLMPLIRAMNMATSECSVRIDRSSHSSLMETHLTL